MWISLFDCYIFLVFKKFLIYGLYNKTFISMNKLHGKIFRNISYFEDVFVRSCVILHDCFADGVNLGVKLEMPFHTIEGEAFC